MKTPLEAHSLNSLAVRLKLLASRGTLRRWMDEGKLKAEFHGQPNSSGGSRHLLFRTKHLDSVLTLLENTYKEKAAKLAKTACEALRFRAQADALALQRHEQNLSNELRGRAPVIESDPVLNDDDCRGVISLETRQPETLFRS